MSRFVSLGFPFFILLTAGLVFTGCEDTPTAVEDVELQAFMEVSTTGFTVSPEKSIEVEASFQGLDEFPSATSPNLNLQEVSREGDPSEGIVRYEVGAGGSLESVLSSEQVLIEGQSGGQNVTDTVSVAATPLNLSSEFTSDFVALDFEGDVSSRSYLPDETGVTEPVYQGSQRTITAEGETDHALVNPSPPSFSTPQDVNQPPGSNSVRYLSVDASSGDALKIERQANLAGLDYFTFLVRPQGNEQFTLTVRLQEEQGGSTITHEADIPVPNVDGWLKYQITYDDLENFFDISDFNPVDQRSGGNGPLKSISFVTDADVEYGLDQILFGIEGVGARAEIHDFEEPTLAWGPPFVTDNEYGFSESVDAESDGYTSHSVSGTSTFGFNFGDDIAGVALLYLDVDSDDVLSFRARAQSGTASFSASLTSFEGGFDGSASRDLTDTWQRYEVPIGELGDDPAALNGELVQFVFTPDGDVLFDDVKIMPN